MDKKVKQSKSLSRRISYYPCDENEVLIKEALSKDKNTTKSSLIDKAVTFYFKNCVK